MKHLNVVKKFGAGVALSVLGVGSAMAALPTAVGTTITGIQTDALAAIDLVWPLLLAVLGAFILLKIVKRAIKAAT